MLTSHWLFSLVAIFLLSATRTTGLESTSPELGRVYAQLRVIGRSNNATLPYEPIAKSLTALVC